MLAKTQKSITGPNKQISTLKIPGDSGALAWRGKAQLETGNLYQIPHEPGEKSASGPLLLGNGTFQKLEVSEP